MKKITTFFMLLVSVAIFSQIKIDSTKAKQLDEVIINKISTNSVGLPNQVKVITSKHIDFQNFQSTAEMLSNSGSLFVQKSQQGAGSPTIRGLEASRVLLLVDGIRMNNLIFRAGHLQNIITVDESFLDNVGILYGPTSTLFGSDALGGTVAMSTKKAKFLGQVNNTFSGNINTRYSSSNEEKSVAFNLNYATEKFASLTMASFNDFGDLKMGKKKNHNGDFFGERPFYVETIGGIDQLTVNDDKYVQRNSGYKQYNVLQKFAYKTNAGFEHGLNLQFSTSSDIPRYDRLTETTSTGLKHAEWYYGPQQRILAVYSLEKKKAFLSTDFKLNVAYQNAKESRHNRNFKKYDLQNRQENVNMFSISADLKKVFSKSELFYGMESYYETLKSSAFSNNINTGIIAPITTRYPNGDNNMLRNDIYISYNEELSSQTFWNAGARVGYTALKSTIVDNTLFPLPYDSISQDNITYSGTMGINHNPSSNVSLKANVSSGFRVANVDDLSKIFESVPSKSNSQIGTLIVPNKDLKPEKTITTDLGFTLQSNSKKTSFDFTYFYTRMFDAIVTDSFTYNGQSQVTFNGFLNDVQASQNKGKAYITGFSTSLNTYLCTNLQFNANFDYTLGRVVKEGSQSPLDHISPYFGKFGFTYSKNVLVFEAYMLFNGKKDISDYSTSGEDNQIYAPAGGMPAWETYNLKTSFKIIKEAILFIGVENMLDTQYRYFASGINAPGRNIYGGLKYSF